MSNFQIYTAGNRTSGVPLESLPVGIAQLVVNKDNFTNKTDFFTDPYNAANLFDPSKHTNVCTVPLP